MLKKIHDIFLFLMILACAKIYFSDYKIYFIIIFVIIKYLTACYEEDQKPVYRSGRQRL